MSDNGTIIKLRYPVLYFDSVSINNAEQLKAEIEENQKCLKELEGELLALAMATPKDICIDKEDVDPFEYVNEKVTEILNELYETKATLDELYNIESLLDEWEYSYYASEKELYPNGGVENAFREDKHVEIDYIKKDSFNLTPNDKTLLDIFVRATKNVQLNKKNIEFVKDKYIILFQHEIFADYNDQFIFTSEENARKVLLDKIDLRVHDYINKEFIKTHKEFFYSFKNVLNDEEYNLLIDSIDKFENNEAGYDVKIMELVNTIYTLLNKGILVMLEKHIKVVKLDDIAKGVE